MPEFKCQVCERSFSSEDSLNQHFSAKHGTSSSSGNISSHRNFKRYFLIFMILISVGILSYTLYVRGQVGGYDDFAKCLTGKGIVVYGNDFCQYTGKQLNWFGSSEKYLNYVKCVDNKELCDSKGVSITPTWEINGKVYEGVQSFEKLSELSGCAIG